MSNCEAENLEVTWTARWGLTITTIFPNRNGITGVYSES